MRKAILIALVMGLLGGGAAVVAAQVSDDSTTTTSTTDDTTSTTQTTTGDDISGPCDEAEHANDPECLPGGEDFEQARDDRFDDDCGFDDDDASTTVAPAA